MNKHSTGGFLIFLIFIFLLFTFKAYSCEKDVSGISIGQPANCTGFLVSKPQMQEFAKTADQLVIEQKLNKVNEQLLVLSKAEIEFYKTRAKKSEESLSQVQSKSFWTGVGGFALGVVLTGIAAKAAIEASK